MIEFLTKEDFKKIGIVANHCDYYKLNIAISEALDFDLPELTCNLHIEWDSEDEEWVKLINGGEYIGCNGITYKQKGLKAVVAYFAYARYIILNGFDDTASGMVTKTNEFSIPKPLKELQAFSDKYRNMAKITFDRVSNYICTERDFFGSINGIECKGCGCGSTDCRYGYDTNTKGYGLKANIIRR